MQKQYSTLLDTKSMEQFIVMLAPSSDNVVRPTSNSVPEPPGTPESSNPSRAAGSPGEPNTKKQ